MELIEASRVMIARPELWESDFTNALVGMLAPEERLNAIPDGATCPAPPRGINRNLDVLTRPA